MAFCEPSHRIGPSAIFCMLRPAPITYQCICHIGTSSVRPEPYIKSIGSLALYASSSLIEGCTLPSQALIQTAYLRNCAAVQVKILSTSLRTVEEEDHGLSDC